MNRGLDPLGRFYECLSAADFQVPNRRGLCRKRDYLRSRGGLPKRVGHDESLLTIASPQRMISKTWKTMR